MHKSYALISVILLLTAGCSGGSSIPSEFVSESGGFSIVAPAALKESVQEISSGYSKLTVHGFVGGTDLLTYFVSYIDYAEEIGNTLDAETILEQTRTQLIGSNGAIVLSESKISLDGNPGLEITFDSGPNDPPERTVKARVILVGNRLYQILVAIPKGDVNTTDNNNFLQSFKLLSH